MRRTSHSPQNAHIRPIVQYDTRWPAICNIDSTYATPGRLHARRARSNGKDTCRIGERREILEGHVPDDTIGISHTMSGIDTCCTHNAKYYLYYTILQLTAALPVPLLCFIPPIQEWVNSHG